MSNLKKKHNDNFPVGLMVSPKLKKLVKTYYEAASFADDIADDPLLDKFQKNAKLNDIRDAFLSPDSGNNLIPVRKLGHLFVKENLDASLFTDLLKAFERDANNRPVRIWEELIDYCRYSAAPVGRFMLAIHDESPTAYMPAENLCIILQLLDHISDIKDDLSLLNRVYIPQDSLEKYNIRISDLGLSISTPDTKQMLTEILQKIDKMQADSEVLPGLIKNFRLRTEVCVILSLTNSVIKKYQKSDILQQCKKPSVTDWVWAIISAPIKALFCKHIKQGRVL